MPEPKQQLNQQLPAWRIEVAEKVRARKAQQSGNQAKDEQPSAQQNGTAIASSTQNSELRTQNSDESGSSNPKIQAALLRAKRANEKAIRASIPRIEPARPLSQTMALAAERTATAKVLAEPVNETYLHTEEEVHETVPLFKEETPELKARSSDSPVNPVNPVSYAQKANPQFTRSTGLDSLQFKTQPLPVSSPPKEPVEEKPKPLREPVKCLDENCIIDYLEAELQKVERATKQTQKLRKVSLQTQATILLIDFVAILISCLPFLLLAKLINGNQAQSTAANVLICFLVSAFYLFSTQLLCCKTFGMMATKTYIVNAATGSLPTVFLVLLRTLGFYVSLLPALVGFFWMAIDSGHRTWMDMVSGTKIVPG